MQCRFCKHYEMQTRQRSRGNCTALGAMVQGKWKFCRLFVPALGKITTLTVPDQPEADDSLLLPEISLRKLLEEIVPENPTALEVEV